MKQFWWQVVIAGFACEALDVQCQPPELPFGHCGSACVCEVSSALCCLLVTHWRPLVSSLLSWVTTPISRWQGKKTDSLNTKKGWWPSPDWLWLCTGDRYLWNSLWNSFGLQNATSWVATVAAQRPTWSNSLQSPERNKRRLLPCAVPASPQRTKRKESFCESNPNFKRTWHP